MISDLSIAMSQLHSLLRQLSQAETILAEGPTAIVAAENAVVLAEQQIEEQKAAIKLSRKTSDELSLKLKTKEAELRKLEGQLNAATSNKEFDITKGQIANVSVERAELENAAFEAMENIDAAQAALKRFEKDLKDCRQEAQSVRADVESRQPGVHAALEGLQNQIAEAEKIIPGDARAAYRRLRLAHGAGALAGVEDDFCEGCDSRITNQDLVRIRTGDFLFCRGCNRGLYVV